MRLHLPVAVRRTARLAAIVILFGVLAGATYQGVATALERREFPQPGRMVDVGSHQLHIHCTGEGAPTVVLEAAAASMSASWGLVQPRIARTTRVCSYDRSGLGWSEAGDSGFTPSMAVDELRAVLKASGEAGPFVIAGRGLGAAFATAFAGRYPDQTAALVTIDEPDEASGLRERSLARVTAVTPWLARMGILRLLRTANRAAAGLPAGSAGATRTFLYRPDHLSRAALEVKMWRDAVRLAGESRPSAPIHSADGDPDRSAAAIEAAVAAIRGG